MRFLVALIAFGVVTGVGYYADYTKTGLIVGLVVGILVVAFSGKKSDDNEYDKRGTIGL